MNRKALVLSLFFFSGISGLVYEVVWMRHLGVIFGNTVYATSTILAGFMGGLAIGSYLFGRLADRKLNLLKLYGWVEIAVGGIALLFPFILRSVTPLYVWYADVSALSYHKLSFVHALLIVCVIFLPTVLMGGTLPILTKYLSREFSSLGRNLSLLYGLNTLGAVLGCAAAGLVLIGSIGVNRTTWLAVAVNLAVGLTALFLSRSSPAVAAPAPPEDAAAEGAAAYPAWIRRTVLWLFALSGFTAMAYEVLWTRVLVFLTGGTAYAFTVMLTTYLSGLALGSVLAVRLVDRSKRLVEAFSVLQMLVGLGILATLAATPQVLGALGSILFRESSLRYGDLSSFLALQAVLSLVFIFPFTVLMGMCLPVAGKICTTSYRETGKGIGITYFADTIGCIAGALAAGFLLIPAFGTLVSLRSLAIGNLAIGALALACTGTAGGPFRFSPKRALTLAVLTALVAVVAGRSIPNDTFTDVFTAPGSRLAYVNEDVGGTVTIEQYKDYKTISINGINVAGTDLTFETTQKLQAHLALLLHPNPRRVMQIGFGSGGTAWSISTHPVAQIDCVEITAAMLKAREQMQEVNHGILRDPRVHVFIDDARSYMLKSKAGYDAILSDSIHPRRAGNGTLYSVDYFRLCKARLNRGGIFSAWLPIYGLSLEDYRVTVRSLKEVFPHVYLFHTPVGRNEWTIILGTLEPLRIDLDSIRRKLAQPAVRDDLSAIFINREQDVLDCFLLGDRTLDRLIGTSRVLNTDDFPYLEYIAAKSSIVTSREELLKPLYRELVACREDVFPYVTGIRPGTRDALEKSYASAFHAMKGRLYELDGPAAAPAALNAYKTALELDPENYVVRDLLPKPPANPAF